MIPARRFLREVMSRGLDLAVVTPEDVLGHVTPEVLAHHMPIALKARLLQASLSAERMTPDLVVQVVGVDALAEHVPMPILWACVRACAVRQLQGQPDAPAGTSPSIAAIPAPAGASGGAALTPAALMIGTVDDMQLKPPKPARPAVVRPGATQPPRISSLSPRSQIVRRGPDAAGSQSPGGFLELGRADSVADFEIVEETEVPVRQRERSPGDAVDDETRPGKP
jgi:hypothetical protein